MSLVTCCPDCATTFRVSPAQLSARGGRVRCGKCATIFDGVASLLTEEAIAALPEMSALSAPVEGSSSPVLVIKPCAISVANCEDFSASSL